MKLTFLKRITLRFSAKLTQLMRIALRIALPIALLNTWDYDRKKSVAKWTQTMASTFDDITKHLHISSKKWYMIYEENFSYSYWKTTPRLNNTGSRRLRVSLIRRVADSLYHWVWVSLSDLQYTSKLNISKSNKVFWTKFSVSLFIYMYC